MVKKTNGPAAKKPRIVKVYDHHVTYNAHLLYKTHVIYPKIRLAGKWLADCGFAPGQHIEVVQEPQRLVIQVVPPPKKAQKHTAVTHAPTQKPRRRAQVPYVLNKNTDAPTAVPVVPTAMEHRGYQKVKSNFAFGWPRLPLI
ncbi:SymE family type I addiction module toxin [Edaphocola flava]|uniref:SymE family type I addiction module toxin n=1 Tax=Edaphocola flava TaxID=2499629 RepID=UPI00100B0943|nr:SymE family type I addiction module toxin [Edaphocola flava]